MGRDDMRDEPRGRRGRPRFRTGLGALAVAAVAAVALPAVAQGKVTVAHAGGVLTLTGTPGVDGPYFQQPFGSPPGTVTISDSEGGVEISPSAAGVCSPDALSPEEAVCQIPTKVIAHLGDGDDWPLSDDVNIPFEFHGEGGNDTLNGGLANDRLFGGPGNDTLRGDLGDDLLDGGDGDDVLLGREGNDHLLGGAGNDTLDGQAGNDTLDGGAGDDTLDGNSILPDRLAGADTYVGGPGFDRFSYFMRSEPVTVTLDGVANDGSAGEGDNIHPDVDEVGGGWKDDTLIGSDGDNELWGDFGNDTIRGLGGNDKLWGSEGMDLIDGGPGNDKLTGGCHSDRLIGGPGVDSLISDDCTSPFERGVSDILEANDGEKDELIFCSLSHEAPADTAIVDPIDPVTNTGAGACGTIQVVTPAGGGAPGGGGGGAPAPGGGGGVVTPPAPTTLKGKVSLRFGKHATLLTGAGNAKKSQAAKQQMRLKGKTRTLTLGTLRATSAKVKITAAATFRKGTKRVRLGKKMVRRPNMVSLGKKTLTVTKAAPKTLTIRVPAKGANAVGKKVKRVKVKVAFTVRNARGKVVKKSTKTYPVTVVRE